MCILNARIMLLVIDGVTKHLLLQLGQLGTDRKERGETGCVDQREDSGTSRAKMEVGSPSLDSIIWGISSFSLSY